MASAASTTTKHRREVMVNPTKIAPDKVTKELVQSIIDGGSPLDPFITQMTNEMIMRTLRTIDETPNLPALDLNRFYNLLLKQMQPNATERAVFLRLK